MKQIIKKGQVYAKKNPKKVLAALGFLFVIGILIYMLQPEPEKPKPKSRRPITRVRQTAVEVDDDDDVIPRTFGRRPAATRLAGGRGGGGSSSVTTRSSGTTTRSSGSSGTTTRSSGSSGTTTSDGDETTPNDEEEDIDNGDGDETTPNDEEVDLSDLNGYWAFFFRDDLRQGRNTVSEEDLVNSEYLIIHISEGDVDDIYYHPSLMSNLIDGYTEAFGVLALTGGDAYIYEIDQVLFIVWRARFPEAAFTYEMQPPFDTYEVDLIQVAASTDNSVAQRKVGKTFKLVRLDNPDPYWDRSIIVNYQTKINSLEQLNGSWNLESVPYSEIKEPVDDIFDKIFGVGRPVNRFYDMSEDGASFDSSFTAEESGLTGVDIQLNNTTSLVISSRFETMPTDGSPGAEARESMEYRTFIYTKGTIVLLPEGARVGGTKTQRMDVIFEYETYVYWLMIEFWFLDVNAHTRDPTAVGGKLFESRIIINKLIREDIDTSMSHIDFDNIKESPDQTNMMNESQIQNIVKTDIDVMGPDESIINIDPNSKRKGGTGLTYSEILKQYEYCKQKFVFSNNQMGSEEECEKLSDSEYNELLMLISENKRELTNLLPHLDFNIQNINDFRSFKNKLSQEDIAKLKNINNRAKYQRNMIMLKDELFKAGLEVKLRDLMAHENLEQFVNTLNWKEQQIFKDVVQRLRIK